MTGWEYRVEELSDIQTANQLNFIGKEGWELVYVQVKESETSAYRCFFKRRKEESLF
jgi:hypothetical protein